MYPIFESRIFVLSSKEPASPGQFIVWMCGLCGCVDVCGVCGCVCVVYVNVCVYVCVCVCVCVGLGLVMCECFDNSMGALVIRVLVFTVFFIVSFTHIYCYL
jgi:hypothetical protein